MFIHLGNDVVIRAAEIVAIFGEELLSNSSINQQFIESRKKDRHVINIGETFTKSMVVTENTVYLSPFSVLTLKRRNDS